MCLFYVVLICVCYLVWLGIVLLVVSNSKLLELYKGVLGYLFVGGVIIGSDGFG